MGCQNSNATAPSPGIAPAIPPGADPAGGTPDGRAIDPRRVAEDLVRRHGEGGMDPRVRAACPGFDAPFFQAGLAGYSDAAMRIVARRHGCPYCVTEALLDQTLLGGGRGFVKADLGDLADNVPGGDEDLPLAGQIMGSEPEEMAAAAVKMLEQGSRRPKEYRKMVGDETDRPEASLAARTFSTIDINLACPVKKISKKARGGHWLSEPAGAIRILEAVREAVPAEIPVTVKLRRSFDDTDEMRENFFRLFDAAYDIGCAWVCVHGRTVQQKYVGPSRWDMLREIATRQHPGTHRERAVFGSGDIWEAGDVFRMIAYTGMTGVSVARGCIGNPWIFRQCRSMLAGREPSPPTVAEQRSVLEQHFGLALAVNERMVRGVGDARVKRAENFTGKTMRKFGIRFAAHHPRNTEVRKRFVGVETLGDWRAVLDEFYPEADR
jgi:tRNA-dihydrouridine synthase B